MLFEVFLSDQYYDETIKQLKKVVWPSVLLNICFAFFAYGTYSEPEILLTLSFVNSIAGFLLFYLCKNSSTPTYGSILFYVILRSSLWGLIGYYGLALAPNVSSAFFVTAIIIGVTLRALSALALKTRLALIYSAISIAGLLAFSVQDFPIGQRTFLVIPVSALFILLLQQTASDKKRILSESNLRNNLTMERSMLMSILKGFPGKLSIFDSELRYVNVSEFLSSEFSFDSILGEKLGFSKKADRFVDIVKSFSQSSEQQRVFEDQLMTSKGLRWHYISLLKNTASGQIICMSLDIEQQKEIELERQNNNRLVSLGELCSNIAHEINNPLTVISAKASLLKRKAVASTESSYMISGLEQIENSSDRIARIIKGLQTASRDAENDPLIEANLNDIIQDVLLLSHEKLVKNQIQLINDLDQGSQIKVFCQPTQLSQVLINLINNSCDAILNFPERWIKISMDVSPNKIAIRITDSGAGIPAEIAQKIMKPFFTTKGPGKGTGLGLSLSKKLIERQHGNFYLNLNSPNTEFVIELGTHDIQKLAAS